LNWIYQTLLILRQLLCDNGSIWVHLDWHVGHYVKVLMDEIFGYEKFRSEITWKCTAAHNDTRGIGNIADMILYYGISDQVAYNPQFMPYDKEYIDSFCRFEEKDGQRYRLHQIERNPAIGIRENLINRLKPLPLVVVP
jgi:adenine-specific DNA-methyltransferase